MKEHFAHARNGNPQLSAPTKHVIDGHEEEWNAKIVEVVDKKRVRRIKEVLACQRKDKNGKITLNKGVELSNMWLDLTSVTFLNVTVYD